MAVAADGTLYAGADTDTLLALNSTGTLKWAYSAPRPIRSSPAIGADGAVFFGCFDGVLRALGSPVNAVTWTPPRTTALLSAPWPNPARGAVSLVARAPAPVSGEAVVLGADGRRVRGLWRGTVSPAPATLSWDGRDDRGRAVASGVYWVALRAGRARDARPLVLER